MPTYKYLHHNFNATSLIRIAQINHILDNLGVHVSLRGLYYRMLSAGHIEPGQKEYKKLGDLVNNARNAGLIDWEAIIDETRALELLTHWQTPDQLLSAAARSWRVDKWTNQPMRLYVMVEKLAVIPMIRPVCNRWDVPFFASKGYSSATAIRNLGRQMKSYIEDHDQIIEVLYLGDHDPTGLDIDDDLIKRLSMYAEHPISVKRIALTMDQIRQHDLAPFWAKATDSRKDTYVAKYGTDECWELDALEPKVMSDIINKAIEDRVDPDLLNARYEEEQTGQSQIDMLIRVAQIVQRGNTHARVPHDQMADLRSAADLLRMVIENNSD